MRYVKRNAIAGHRFESWEGLQAHLAWWQREIADRRCHGTTGEVPLVRFEREAGRLREALAFLVEREVSRKDERRIEMAFKIDGSTWPRPLK